MKPRHNPPAAPPQLPAHNPTRPTFTEDEEAEMLDQAAQVVSQFGSQGDVLRMLKRRWPDRAVGPAQAKRLTDMVLAGWASEDEATKRARRAKQVALLESAILRSSTQAAVALSTEDSRGEKRVPNQKDAREWEKLRLKQLQLLADLTGTVQAQEVNVNLNVNVSETLMMALGSLTEDQQQQMLQQSLDAMRAAEELRRLQAGAITTTGEEAAE